ncbi:HesA/MoeB/ThiF family protein [Tropicimonas sp. S265A]|uniref:HesA/MoeB/ThiF family protein n=1 Tax=Tropicimonas sp. S265A TaxID=3415134 RepID=UPI003C7E4909
MTRYARQTLVFGAQAQARFGAARVLVIGAGGLAAPVLPYLAGAGVGRIEIVDPDVISLSNLHRQILFSTDQIGMCKADAARDALHRLNPETTLIARDIAFDPATGPALVADADLVIDCADSFAASYAASDICAATNTPLITASVLLRGGYVCGVCGGAPSLRAVFPDPPETAASCATAGVSGPAVGLVGAAQAQMALDLISGTGQSPLGLMVQFDTAAWRSARFRFDDAKEPDTRLAFIAPTAIRQEDLVLDLRTADEAPAPITTTALRLATDTRPPLPAEHQRTVLACATGLRAWRLGHSICHDWPGEIVLTAAPFSTTET